MPQFVGAISYIAGGAPLTAMVRRVVPCSSLSALAREINPVVRGWINYYGRYYRSTMDPLLDRIDVYVRRRAQRKYKRLREHCLRAWARLASVNDANPSSSLTGKASRPYRAGQRGAG